MIAFYGFGGGFGHLSRIRTFIHTYGIEEPYLILTNNSCAYQLFDKQSIAFLPIDCAFEPEPLRNFIRITLEKYTPKTLYVDTFPGGILGELSDDLLDGISVHYLARRLKWNKYKPLITHSLSIDCAYVFEPLETDHEHFVNQASNIQNTSLEFPTPANIPEQLKNMGKPIWLIVHTTHQEEVEVLTDQAIDLARIEEKDPQMVLLTDQSIKTDRNIIVLHNENPIDWFPHAEKIFTGGGFNTWYQLAPWRSKHVAIPFPRKFDDQFWRVKQG